MLTHQATAHTPGRDGGGAGRRKLADHWPVLLAVGTAIVVRLVMLASPAGEPDADGAVSGLMALDIARGEHFWLLYAGQEYAGSLDAWFQAASISLLGLSPVSLGLPLALFETATVGLLTWLVGRQSRSVRLAAWVGVVASVFPWWWLHWGSVWPGGYALSVTLAAAALVVALTRRPATVRSAGAVGLLAALAMYSQPLSVSYVVVAVVAVLTSSRSLWHAASLSLAGLVGGVPAGLLWLLGLNDGTHRDVSGVEGQVTLGTVLDLDGITNRADDLFGAITREALGIAVTDEVLLVPLVVANLLCVGFWLVTAVTVGMSLWRLAGPGRHRLGRDDARRPWIMTLAALAGVVLTAGVVYLLFPPAIYRFTPRYFFPALPMVGVLLVCWVGVVTARWRAARTVSWAASAGLCAYATAWAAAPAMQLAVAPPPAIGVPSFADKGLPTLAEAKKLADELSARGVTCVVGGYWQVYPVALASEGRLTAESTFVNRMGDSCPKDEGTAWVFGRPAGQVSTEEEKYVQERDAPEGVISGVIVAYP